MTEKREDYPLPEEACVALGGHCYEESPWVTVADMIPPYATHWRICKHCGHRQIGKEQPRILWSDEVKND
jgi:hypothetical protein